MYGFLAGAGMCMDFFILCLHWDDVYVLCSGDSEAKRVNFVVVLFLFHIRLQGVEKEGPSLNAKCKESEAARCKVQG